jgi:sugar phosphate isomerase/epimerase
MNSSISRRDFLQAVALTTATLTTLPAFSKNRAPKYKMGLQLFTIRDAMASDLKNTLKKVSELGYQDTETYGFDPANKKYYGLNAVDFKKLMEDNNLTTTSGHYDLFSYIRKSDDELKSYLDRSIEGAHILGQKYITWPWLDPDSRTMESFKVLVKKLNLAGEHVTKAGLGFAYHNHDFEFIDHNGENGYDLIMRETDPSAVKLQIDLYWAMHSSKLTPAELFRKQPGRFVMWHIKDMDKATRDYTELGNGSIDYNQILPDASLAGLQYYYLEQGGNFASNSMQSIADSAAFFKKKSSKVFVTVRCSTRFKLKCHLQSHQT